MPDLLGIRSYNTLRRLQSRCSNYQDGRRGFIGAHAWAGAQHSLDDMPRGEAGMYSQFSERLERVARLTDGIGWGFHDYVEDVVATLADELGDEVP